LFIPPQGDGRLDNPIAYQVLYASDSPAGACAEVFNRGKYRTQWSRDMLRPLPGNPDAKRSIAWYEIDDSITVANLDDPRELLSRGLRPSDVVTRDYARTQNWALKIFNASDADGIRWWSYHDSRWGSFGLWSTDAISAFGADRLEIDHPAIREAAEVLSIRLAR
jgi:hypothetical protein